MEVAQQLVQAGAVINAVDNEGAAALHAALAAGQVEVAEPRLLPTNAPFHPPNTGTTTGRLCSQLPAMWLYAYAYSVHMRIRMHTVTVTASGAS